MTYGIFQYTNINIKGSIYLLYFTKGGKKLLIAFVFIMYMDILR